MSAFQGNPHAFGESLAEDMTATAQEIEIGAIVTIGKAKTLWEVTDVAGAANPIGHASLVKVDGEGYVSMTRPLEALTLQAGPCQDVTLAQLIEAKRRAREAALEVAERLRLWPTPEQVYQKREIADIVFARWVDAHDRHHVGRAGRNVETAIAARRAAQKGA